MQIRTWVMTATVGLLAAFLLVGYGSWGASTTPQVDAAQRTIFDIPGSGERTIHLQATEMDARRAADRFPEGYPHTTRAAFPEYFGDPNDHTDRTGDPGYYLFKSGENEYRIGSYMWLPAADFIVYQGERITLEMLGVRGTSHRSVLMDPDGNMLEEFTVYRGGLEIIEFTADKAGVYELVCLEHLPTMVAYIHVLPTR